MVRIEYFIIFSLLLLKLFELSFENSQLGIQFGHFGRVFFVAIQIF